jgi:hypothetical protein
MASAEAVERVMRVKRLVVCLSVIVLIVASGFFAFWAMGTSWFWGFQISAYGVEAQVITVYAAMAKTHGSAMLHFVVLPPILSIGFPPLLAGIAAV